MMSTHCAHNAPPTSFKWPPVRGWDAELLAWYRTIPAGNVFIRLTSVSAASATCKNAGNCKFSFTRQHSCAPLSPSHWRSTSSQRCRINGLPDLVYYWASLKGGKKRALDFDWWVPLSSQITVHPSPNSQVPTLLFSCAWPPILTQPPLIWILSFDSTVIIDLPVSRATSPSVIVWDIEIHSWTTQASIPSKKQWLKLPNKVERTRTALAITIWGQSPDQRGKKGGGWALCPNRERWHNTHQLKAMRFMTSLIVVLYATKRSFRDEFSTDVQPFILNQQII